MYYAFEEATRSSFSWSLWIIFWTIFVFLKYDLSHSIGFLVFGFLHFHYDIPNYGFVFVRFVWCLLDLNLRITVFKFYLVLFQMCCTTVFIASFFSAINFQGGFYFFKRGKHSCFRIYALTPLSEFLLNLFLLLIIPAVFLSSSPLPWGCSSLGYQIQEKEVIIRLSLHILWGSWFWLLFL